MLWADTRGRPQLISRLEDPAPVDQSAESMASKSIQCGFESHPGHTPNPTVAALSLGADKLIEQRHTVALRDGDGHAAHLPGLYAEALTCRDKEAFDVLGAVAELVASVANRDPLTPRTWLIPRHPSL
jgi:hypothetical protein